MPKPEFGPDRTSFSPGLFSTTHWSVVVAAGASDAKQSAIALENLCRTYWYPLYAFVRRQGHSPEDAADLTQAFFYRLLSKGVLGVASPQRGRFRSFLLAALKNFLANEWDRGRAQKRGGSVEIFSLDGEDAERQYLLEPSEGLDPAQLFDRRWALTVLDEALRLLEVEQSAAGKERIFRSLQGFLIGEGAAGSYVEVASNLGLTEAAVKMAVLRLRARCRELLREEIARTVSSPREIDEEYQALVAALRK